MALMMLGLSFLALISFSDAYDPLDPNSNITIIWDILSWTADGYQAGVSIYNYQQYRNVEPPGWMLGWHWQGEEIILGMSGAEAEMQGDCSHIHDVKPHNCERNPKVVDLFPGQTSPTFDPSDSVGMVANCCKGGVISAWGQDPSNAMASFQMTVGLAGTNNNSVNFPTTFTLQTPGLGYLCGYPVVAPPTLFPATDGRRRTQAMLTWNITCTYSQFLAQNEPSCCVSLSSFYSEDIVPCPTCSCACQSTNSNNDSCVESSPQQKISTGLDPMEPIPPILQCTQDMCPIRIHWHVKQNYVSYWRVKMTIINRNYAQNYSQWNVVAQHPNFSNLTEVFSFNYKLLNPYNAPIDAALFWGIPFYNDMLLHAGEAGNVQTEILFQKDPKSFTFRDGWPFPHRVYFNGHDCVLPSPDAYPSPPNRAHNAMRVGRVLVGLMTAAATLILM